MKKHFPPELIDFYINKYTENATKKADGKYNASCPLCKEGKSYKIKKRLYYIPEKQIFCCHNCQKVWTPANWIAAVSGMSAKDISTEIKRHNTFRIETPEDELITKPSLDLPFDAINLSDINQVMYHRNDFYVKTVLDYIRQRKLDVAVNKTILFMSKKDYIHKNRLIIPFYNTDKKVVFYQSRTIVENEGKQYPKYLSKLNSDKTIFGIERLDINIPYIFVFEGPIDSMFVRNGVSMAGLRITQSQTDQLKSLFGYQRIWVLDNDTQNPDVFEKYMELAKSGEKVFVWPKAFSKIKDLNELCCLTNKTEIPPNFFISNTYQTELSVKLAISQSQ